MVYRLGMCLESSVLAVGLGREERMVSIRFLAAAEVSARDLMTLNWILFRKLHFEAEIPTPAPIVVNNAIFFSTYLFPAF